VQKVLINFIIVKPGAKIKSTFKIKTMQIKQSTFDFELFPGEETSREVPVLQEAEVVKENQQVLVGEIVAEEIALKNDGFKKNPRGRMKLSEMNAVKDQPEIPEDAVLFEKRYYSIGAVSEMFKLNQSLIRYWENEFDILKPKKNGKGDRFFRPEDVKNLKLIYHLLRERKYTIEGAKEFLKKNKKADEKFAVIESLKNLKSFLHELKANL
jgi:DNA-binding transcriptional MerR regulator